MTRSPASSGFTSISCPECGTEIAEEFVSYRRDFLCWRCGYRFWCNSRTVEDTVVLDIISGCGQEPEEMKAEFRRLLGPSEPRHVIVNLTRTDCLDSGFIAGLIILQRMVQYTGASVVLCGLRPTVREVFVRTQLCRLFQIAESEQEAVEVTHTEEASAGYVGACLQTNTP